MSVNALNLMMNVLLSQTYNKTLYRRNPRIIDADTSILSAIFIRAQASEPDSCQGYTEYGLNNKCDVHNTLHLFGPYTG